MRPLFRSRSEEAEVKGTFIQESFLRPSSPLLLHFRCVALPRPKSKRKERETAADTRPCGLAGPAPKVPRSDLTSLPHTGLENGRFFPAHIGSLPRNGGEDAVLGLRLIARPVRHQQGTEPAPVAGATVYSCG